MKKTLLFNLIAFSLLALVSVEKANAQATATDLFFSEYIEGSGNNKAIEIFNGTGAAIDLSAYSVKQSYNGQGWGIREAVAMIEYVLPLSGTLAPGDVYVFYNGDCTDATIIAAADLKLVYTAATAGCRMAAFNGNDPLGLFKNDVLIDIIGEEKSIVASFDAAGTTGATLDHTMIRKATVTEGSVNWATSAGTNADDSQWIVNAKDFVSNIGTHTFGTTGLNKFSVSKTTIYPNPAKSFFNIKAAEGKYLVTVNNSIGSIVKSVDINSAEKIEISDLRPGIYYVTVENMKTNRKEVQKLIVR